jgi:hypothetical protein
VAGTNPQLYIRISATLDEMKRNIAEAKGGIETTTASMQKLAASFSGDKLIQAAHNVTAAVNQIGGASKLTEAEQARVNATVEKALEKYRVLGREAPPHMIALAEATRKVEPATSALHKSLGDIGTQIQATALGFVSAQAIIGGAKAAFSTFVDFLKGSVQAYANAEAAAKKMTTALQSQGRATPAVIAQYNALATQFQNTTVYSDDLINEMQALLVEVGGVMPGEMQKALTAATNLASGLGVDLQQATMLVGKAFAGETGTLKRYGIVIDEAKLKAEGMPAVLDAIQSKFGGQAQAEVDTYAGRVKQLANEWDNLQEAVGKSIVTDPLLAAGLRLLADKARGTTEETDKLSTSFTVLWSNLQGNGQATAAILTWLSALADASNRAEAGAKILANLKPMIGHKTAVEESAEAERKLATAAKAAGEAADKAHKLAADAAKRHAEALAAMFSEYSGANAAQQMADLDTTFRRLADSGHLTEAQFRRIAGEARALSDSGLTLTARLRAIVVELNAETHAIDLWVRAMREMEARDAAAATAAQRNLEALGHYATKLPIATRLVDEYGGYTGTATLKTRNLSGVVWQVSEAAAAYQGNLAGVTLKTRQSIDAVDALGQAFGQMSSMASGSLASVLSGVADLILSLNSALKMTQQAFGGEEGSGSSGNGIAKIAMMATGWGAVAFAAYKAGKAIYTAMNDGRKAVTDFADSFGGFDKLHQRLLDSLGGRGRAVLDPADAGGRSRRPEQSEAGCRRDQ